MMIGQLFSFALPDPPPQLLTCLRNHGLKKESESFTAFAVGKTLCRQTLYRCIQGIVTDKEESRETAASSIGWA